MGTQNITLALPVETLHEAKELAARKRMSMSGLMVELISEAVGKDREYEAAKRQALSLLDKGLNLGLGDSIPWAREEIHERNFGTQ